MTTGRAQGSQAIDVPKAIGMDGFGLIVMELRPHDRPTLVRRFPGPVNELIGYLSTEEKVLVGLDIRPHGPDRGDP